MDKTIHIEQKMVMNRRAAHPVFYVDIYTDDDIINGGRKITFPIYEIFDGYNGFVDKELDLLELIVDAQNDEEIPQEVAKIIDDAKAEKKHIQIDGKFFAYQETKHILDRC